MLARLLRLLLLLLLLRLMLVLRLGLGQRGNSLRILTARPRSSLGVVRRRPPHRYIQ
jgi:hypothetical protein